MNTANPRHARNVGTRAYVLTIGTYGGIMLSTVNAAEALFRHDTRTRARELAILGAIRDRREALAATQHTRTAARRPLAWPRPIGVSLAAADAVPVCA
jgi:hypothetical protein